MLNTDIEVDRDNPRKQQLSVICMLQMLNQHKIWILALFQMLDDFIIRN